MWKGGWKINHFFAMYAGLSIVQAHVIFGGVAYITWGGRGKRVGIQSIFDH